jgi:outer membrane biosynthesis protein TonB
MPATRRTRAQTAKGSAVSLDTILLATAVGAGVAAYFFLDVAPEVVAASCVAAVGVVLIYGGKVQKYVRGRKPKAAKPKAAPKSPKPTRVQPKRSATPEPLSRKPSSPKPKAKPAAKPAVSPKKPAVKASPAKKPASKPKAPAKKPATRKAAVSPKKRGGSRATLEALASARSTPARRRVEINQ